MRVSFFYEVSQSNADGWCEKCRKDFSKAMNCAVPGVTLMFGKTCLTLRDTICMKPADKKKVGIIKDRPTISRKRGGAFLFACRSYHFGTSGARTGATNGYKIHLIAT